jgi:hypothetical protein
MHLSNALGAGFRNHRRFEESVLDAIAAVAGIAGRRGRFQISVLLNAAETTVSQARVYRASALLCFRLDFVVALPFGAHRHYRPRRETFAESPMKSDSAISRRALSDLDSI